MIECESECEKKSEVIAPALTLALFYVGPAELEILY